MTILVALPGAIMATVSLPLDHTLKITHAHSCTTTLRAFVSVARLFSLYATLLSDVSSLR